VKDLYDLVEIIVVDRHNEQVAYERKD